MQVLILAGGLGTRLRSVVSDRPKPMADINGKPFLEHLIKNLINNGYKEFILAVGYKNEKIIEYFKDGKEFECEIKYAIESSPLGTGGALANAKKLIKDDIIVLNGDTYFDIDFKRIAKFHKDMTSDYTLALRKVDDVSRYGAVEFDDNSRVIGFTPKGEDSESNYINGGIYIIKKEIIDQLEENKFISLENDIIPFILKEKNMFAYKSDDYFIDIGIPEDYNRFCNDRKVVKG